MGGQLDVLVPPLRGPVHAGDERAALDPPEVAVDEGVPRLGLVVGALGEPEVPGAVVVPAVAFGDVIEIPAIDLSGRRGPVEIEVSFTASRGRVWLLFGDLRFSSV